MTKVNKNKGFTLLEILLVIAAIGILAAIVLVAINPNRQLAQARNLVRQADINTIQKALEQYLIENGRYPIGIDNTYKEICNTGSNSTNQGTVGSNCIDLREIVPDYLASIPVNPTTSVQSGYYVWINDVNNKVAVLAGRGENGKVIGINHLKENIVTDGLVLHLDAGNTASYPGTGSTWFDLSGGNNSGTLVNGVGYNSTNGGSLAFDGSNDYVLLTQTLTTPFTITGFIRYTDHAKTLNTFINTNPHTVLGISLNRLGGGEIYVYIGNGSGWQGIPGIISSQNMNVNQWYQVSFTSTGSGSILYLNGVNVGTSIYSPSGWGSSYYLGTIISGEYLKGNIGTTQVYNRALNPEEIQQNFNATRGRFGL